MTKQTYRPDIDGLRAIAVLSVMLYHLDEGLLSGGFIGVDVFFVISGYLITKLIYQERLETAEFSYSNFYLRRVRRLFPALFATFAISLSAGAVLFSPAHLAELAESLIAATFSVSNIYFWNTAGYFDSDSSLKPLLHTWSLSVEEQFYLIWPVVLVSLCALKPRWAIPGFITIMGVASLLLNIGFFSEQAAITAWFDQQDTLSSLDIRSTAFYWLPFRVFEFSLGAILVWLRTPKAIDKPLVNEAAFILGLGLVLYSACKLTSKVDFPSTAALAPCIGAALMIHAGPSHRFSSLLSNPLMVGIGLISYSLYLIHWPLIVFYKYWRFTELGNTEYIALGLISIILAWLMFKFIETPFRKPANQATQGSSNKPFVAGVIASTLILLGVSSHASTSKGWLWRYPTDVIAQLSYQQGDYTEFFWKNITELNNRPFDQNDSKKILIIGDSMAADFINVLVAAGDNSKLNLSALKVEHNCKGLFPLSQQQYKATYAGAAELCKNEHQRLMASSLIPQATTIVLASYWQLDRLELIQSTVDYLRANTSANVMVLGLKDQDSNGISFLSKHSFSAQTHQLRTPLPAKIAAANKQLETTAKNYHYFDLTELFCDEQGCQRVTPEGYVIIFDQSHLSEKGAKFVAQRVNSASWYPRLMRR